MRVVVTRPAAEAARWVGEMQARGFDAFALPLIVIAPAPDLSTLHAAWRRIADYAAVMFVSGNAVTQFFAQRPADAPAFRAKAWAPGPATALALAEAGVDTALIAAPGEDAPQFDSEALWQRVATQLQPGQRVLIVRGAGGDGQGAGRDWLAGQIEAAGCAVDYVLAYARTAPSWTGAQGDLASRASADGSVWLFSSSESIANLPRLDWSAARAIATHPRIAQAARDLGFGVVCESRPTVEAIVRALESIDDARAP